MKSFWLLGAALLLTAVPAFAQVTPYATAKPYMSLEEARARAHKHLDRLNMMTPDQWAAQKKNPNQTLWTLSDARAHAQFEANRLDMMTDSQWQYKHPAPPPSAVPTQ